LSLTSRYAALSSNLLALPKKVYFVVDLATRLELHYDHLLNMTTYLIRIGRVIDEDGLNSTKDPSRHSCLVSPSERQP
jgi:hypothetical protein